MRWKLELKTSQAFMGASAYTSPLFFLTRQSSETFVFQGNKTSLNGVTSHAQGQRGCSPGSTKRVITHLDTPLGPKNHLSLAPRYFPKLVVMATGYSNCFQDSRILAIRMRFSASASMYAQTYGHQNWCQNWEEDLKLTPGFLWVTRDLSRPHRA